MTAFQCVDECEDISVGPIFPSLSDGQVEVCTFLPSEQTPMLCTLDARYALVKSGIKSKEAPKPGSEMFLPLRAPLPASAPAPHVAEALLFLGVVPRRDADRLHLFFPVPRLLGPGFRLFRLRRRLRRFALGRVELVSFVDVGLFVHLQAGARRAARRRGLARLGRDALLLFALLLRLRLDDGRDRPAAVPDREVGGRAAGGRNLVWALARRPAVLPRGPVGGNDRILRWLL